MSATMTASLMQTIAEISAARIVDCLVEGTVIAGFAAVIVRVLHRQNSGTRFAAWFAALMTIAALPFLSDVVGLHRAGLGAESVARPAITLPESWALYLFAAWAVIAAWCLIRVAVGLKHLHALRKSCVPVDLSRLPARLRETLDATLRRGQRKRNVSLSTSDRVQVPTAIGLISPTVVVPQWAMEELSAEELNQILLHELAHLSRWDDWTNLAQKVVKALFFFHPAVWWIERKVSLEREMACDDAVLFETARPRAYAECLAHLAERTMVRRSLALAQAALGRVRQTSLRVAKILDRKRSNGLKKGSKPVWKPAIALAAGFAIVSMMLAAKEPRLVAFHDVHPDATISASVSPGAPRAIPAKFVTSADRPQSALRPWLKPAAHRVAAKRNGKPGTPRQQFERFETSFVIDHATVAPQLVNLKAPDGASSVSSETVVMWVEIHGAGNSQASYGTRPLYEIYIWRLTVQQPSEPAATSEISRKET